MDLILEDSEVSEITIEGVLEGISVDRGKVIIKGENVGRIKDSEELPSIIKELVIEDSQVIGSKEAAKIAGVSKESVNNWERGESLRDDDARARVLDRKHGIGDVAISKLMDLLGGFDTNELTKPMDKIKAAGIVANIIEKVTPKDRAGNSVVELHLFAPKQNSLEKYSVIDV